MQAEYQTILVKRTDGVATITINRPSKLNALNQDVMTELDAVGTVVGDDPDIRVVIITGAGDRAFVAGADISELNALESANAGAVMAARGQAIFTQFAYMPKPVIAAINGYALGGGCELLLACDIRIAAESARIGQPEINLGIIPGYGGTQRLARLVGYGMAKYLIFSGEQISAAEAREIGLVDIVVPDDELPTAAMELAQKLAAKAPLAMMMAKEAINMAAETGLESGLAFEAAQFGLVAATSDAREGTRAFLEKRAPNFEGR